LVVKLVRAAAKGSVLSTGVLLVANPRATSVPKHNRSPGCGKTNVQGQQEWQETLDKVAATTAGEEEEEATRDANKNDDEFPRRK
jgi:hypothetical protein